MSANYLHGAETIELKKGSVPIRVVKSAVIGLVGSAPKGPFNTLTVVNNEVEAAQFGEQINGFTIPQALSDIYKQGAGTVLVVNVADTTSNTFTIGVSQEPVVISNRAAKLAYAPFGTIDVTDQGGGSTSGESLAEAGTGTGLYSGMVADDKVEAFLVGGTSPVLIGTYNVQGEDSNTDIAGGLDAAITVAGVYGGETGVSGEINFFVAPSGTGASYNDYSIRIRKTISGVETNADFAFSGGVDAQDGFLHYTEGTDYTVDALGNITILADLATIDEDSVLWVSYRRFNPASVTTSRLIGAIDGGTGVKTGSKLFKDAYQLFGFKPKLLIMPGYSSLNTIAAEMIAIASEHKAIALLDAPVGTTVANAVSGRGPLGSINFYTSSERAFLLYPHLKGYNPVKDDNELRPYSQFMAGVIAATDNERGYWISPSNKEIKGIVGVERTISAAINDASTEANQLNEAGITTVFNSFGTGIRTWGNRTGAWPTNTNPKNFISVRRTADVVHESIELAMIQFVDEPLDPINRVTIDAILDSVNAFIRTLVGRGALIQGSACTFDPAKNPAEELALGHVTFDITFMAPTPAERITFESYVDKSLLTSPATA